MISIDEQDFEKNNDLKNKKTLNPNSQKFSRKLKITSQDFNGNVVGLQKLCDLQTKTQIEKVDLQKSLINQFLIEDNNSNQQIEQKNSQVENQSESTESNEVEQIEMKKQQNNNRQQSLDNQIINKQCLFNTPPKKQIYKQQFFSPEKYFKSELYQILPESDEIYELEQLFLKCIGCQCCNGDVDHCDGEICKILGQCYCYSQIESERKNIDIQDDDSELIAEIMKEIEKDYTNWEEMDQL